MWPKCRYGLSPLGVAVRGGRRVASDVGVAAQALRDEIGEPPAARPAPPTGAPRPAAPPRRAAGLGHERVEVAEVPPARRAGRFLRAARARRRGRAGARCVPGLANALWMRGRRCAAAKTGAPSRRERHDAVAVDGEDRDGPRASRGRRVCPGTMKQGKSSVTTSAARAASGRDQAAAGARRLDERPVGEPEPLRVAAVVRACPRGRSGGAAARPRVVETQALVDDERLVERARTRSA